MSKSGKKNKYSIDPENVKRIGILTGGGDCPGLNAVIRGFVRCCNKVYGWKVVGIKDGFDGILSEDFMENGREQPALQEREAL